MNLGLQVVTHRLMRTAGAVVMTAMLLALPATPARAATTTESASDIAANSTGTYVVGKTPGAFPSYTNKGYVDAFIRKYSPAGTVRWTRQFGTTQLDSATAVAVTSSGVFVAGDTDGNLQAGLANQGYRDGFVRKYTHRGRHVWTRQFGTPMEDNAWDIAADGTGIYVVGSTQGKLGAIDSTASDAYVRKYDFAGQHLWTWQAINPGEEAAATVAAYGGSVYIAGYTSGAFLPFDANQGSFDAFVVRCGSDGTVAWTRQFGSSESDGVNDISVDSTGVYVSGSTNGVLTNQASAGFTDAFVRRLGLDGSGGWTRQFGTQEGDSATSIRAHSSGIYVAGSTNGSLPGSTNEGLEDAFVRRYDSSGNLGWTRQFGTTAEDGSAGVAVGSGNVYVAGYTGGQLGAPVSGSWDAFVRAYNANSTHDWTRQFGGKG